MMTAVSTCQVKDILQCARQEAMRLGHHYVGTKHILLGILRDGEGNAGSLLKNMSVDLEMVRQAVVEHVPTHRDLETRMDDLPITMRARQILYVSAKESDQTASEIGVEHLLLALLKDPESAAARILSPMGVNYGRIKQTIA
jgi:ATP-dependent Clp protease ATP-binding subunit ClpC